MNIIAITNLQTAHELREAFLLTEEEFLNKYHFTLPAKDAENVVISCRSGKRAAAAIELLKGMGYTNVK